MAQITYANKVALNENPEIAAINKVSDDDMNEIKSVVNANYNNTIQITNSQPTDSDNKIWIDTGEIQNSGSELPMVYPVGSIYMSVNNTNPATLFGFGTWEQIKDTFLLSAGDTYTAGDTGGSTNHLHKTGIGHAANYLIFDTKNHSETTSSLGFSTVPSASGVSTTSVVDLYSEMQTNSVSNLPPYLVVYMWKRTA